MGLGSPLQAFIGFYRLLAESSKNLMLISVLGANESRHRHTLFRYWISSSYGKGRGSCVIVRRTVLIQISDEFQITS